MYVNVNIYPAMCTAVMSFTTKVITILQVKTYVVTPLEDKYWVTISNNHL